MKKIEVLIQEYEDYSSKFSNKFKGILDEEKSKNVRVEAQKGLALATELRDRYSELIEQTSEGSKENGEFVKQRDRYAEQIENWKKWLAKYGSHMKGIPTTSFDDVAGLEDVKNDIKNYIFMLKNPDVAKKYRIDTNLGILLYGPPGTGKTLIAEAIAHELGVRYFVITPSQIFGSYVGESEKNVRDVFEELRACQDGSVLLVDECESIFARRESNTNRAAIGVANQLLQEMNGQGDSGSSRRVIIGATNRPQLLDEAYLRFKRFSLQYYIGMPNREAVSRVIDLRLKDRPTGDRFKEYLMDKIEGGNYTCADISGIIEKCAYQAVSECRAIKERNGEVKFGTNTAYVNMTIKQLSEVLSRDPMSVTDEMLMEYENFRKSRLNGGR